MVGISKHTAWYFQFHFRDSLVIVMNEPHKAWRPPTKAYAFILELAVSRLDTQSGIKACIIRIMQFLMNECLLAL